MSQYLNGELVNKKTKEVLAIFSLPNRFRDLAREDEFDCYFNNLVPDAKNYDGDDYRGKTTVEKLRRAIHNKEEEIKRLTKKRERLEASICKVKTEQAYSYIHEDLVGLDEYIDDLQADIDTINQVIGFIVYECEFKDFRHMEKRVDQMTGKEYSDEVLSYPMSRGIDLEDVELNLWLNV